MIVVVVLALLTAVSTAGEHTLDQEYHLKESDTVAKFMKDESWTRKESKVKGAMSEHGTNSYKEKSAEFGEPAEEEEPSMLKTKSTWATRSTPGQAIDYEKMDMTTECDWDGVDKKNKKSGEHQGSQTLFTCKNECDMNENCNFLSISSGGYCHMFQTCDGHGKDSTGWETYRQIGDYRFRPPVPDLLFSMINKKYQFSRVYDAGHSGDMEHAKLRAESQKEPGELWKIDPQLGGGFTITNAKTQRVLACWDNYNLGMGTGLNTKTLWKFVPAQPKGWYYIQSTHPDYPYTRYITADSDGRVQCWNRLEANVCRDTGNIRWDGPCVWDQCAECRHGFRRAGVNDWCCTIEDLHVHGFCNCCDAPDCQDHMHRYLGLQDSDGKLDDRFKWRLEDLYDSSSFWKIVFRHENKERCVAEKELKITHGYKKSYETTTAVKVGYSFGLKASAGFAIKKANFGSEASTELKADVSTSLSESAEEYAEVVETTKFDVQPNRCKKYMQIQIAQKDLFTNKDVYFASPSYTSYGACDEDDPQKVYGDDSGPECEPGMVIEIIQSQSDSAEEATGGEYDNPNKWTAEAVGALWGESRDPSKGKWLGQTAEAVGALWGESRDPSSGKWLGQSLYAESKPAETSYAVYGFAALGLGVVLYGALKHYTKYSSATYEEIEALDL